MTRHHESGVQQVQATCDHVKSHRKPSFSSSSQLYSLLISLSVFLWPTDRGKSGLLAGNMGQNDAEVSGRSAVAVVSGLFPSRSDSWSLQIHRAPPLAGEDGVAALLHFDSDQIHFNLFFISHLLKQVNLTETRGLIFKSDQISKRQQQ